VALQTQCKHLDTASQAVLRLGRLCVLIAADRVRSPRVSEGWFPENALPDGRASDSVRRNQNT
ncbi:MAG TPA: hypothetical protein VF397_12820, partial [Pyrinomonadaceae bacterium]